MRHIHKFQTLTGSHACDDLDWSGADCRRYNLFYGWNGSGKTTLSRIFHTLERGALPDGAPSALAFHVPMEGGSIRIADIASHECSLRVFNEDFIKANVSFESGSAQPILIIGQDNIEALAEIQTLEKEEHNLKNQEQGLLRQRPDDSKVNDILTSCARDVIAAFANTPLAGSAFQGRRYMRPQVEARMRESRITADSLASFVLPQKDQDSFRAIIKTEKAPIRTTVATIPDMAVLFRDANALLTTAVRPVDMGLLATDRDLRDWTEAGLHLHSSREVTECLFCHGKLPASLLPGLARLFTNEIGELRQQLKTSITAVTTARTLRPEVPDSGDIYPPLSARFIEARSKYLEGVKTILETLDELQQAVQARLDALPDATATQPEVSLPSEAVDEATTAVSELNLLISEHNSAVANAADNVTNAARAVECHVITTRLTATEYFDKRAQVQRVDGLLGPVRTRLAKVGRDLTAKRAALHDAGIALEQINQHLKRYFRGDDLYLELDTTTAAAGYTLKSRGRRADTLSEGEKSVLALVYFLVKLKEDGCDLASTTIVIDDPVDSQDGPFLFRTFGLIRSELEDAGQLLVFTHNFEFFNLMRDWILDRRTRDHANCYLIEMLRSNGRRTLSVKDLPALLRQHKNEYPYLFAKLHEFSEQGTGLEPPIVPNVGRKVLEYFAAFKWACKTSEGLSEIVRVRFVDDGDAIRRAAGESVLKFVNEYSHGTDFNRPITASVLEARPIALAVRDFIKVADSEHYDSLTAANA